MMGKLGVFPHNLAVCSPLIVGDTLFVITSNGVDEGHKYVVAPKAPSFIAVNKNTGEVLWTNNDPGDKIMHGQWSNPVYAEPNGKPHDYLPRRRRLHPRLRPQGRRADLEVRLQPQGVALRTRPRRHEERLRLHAGRRRQQALHRRRPGPRARHGRRPSVVHRHHQGAEEQGQGPVAGKQATISTRKRRTTRIPASSGTSAATCRTASITRATSTSAAP